MSQVREIVMERENIERDIKNLSARAKQLRLRLKQIDGKILEYIDNKNLDGLKVDDIRLLRSTVKKRETLTKKDKVHEAKRILERYGISDSEKVYKELLLSTRGEELFVDKLTVKKSKNIEDI